MKEKIVVISYLHDVSHRLKEVGSRYNINVVFSAKIKLNCSCPAIEKNISNKGRANRCGVKHEKQVVPYRLNVVYCIPFNCGRFDVGQFTECLLALFPPIAKIVVVRFSFMIQRYCSRTMNKR